MNLSDNVQKQNAGGAVVSEVPSLQVGISRTRDAHESKLSDRLLSLGIQAQQLLFNESCHSVADAERASGATTKEFVKNVCMIGTTVSGEQVFIVAIVPAERRASRSRVQGELKTKGVELKGLPDMADSGTILKLTGYPPGGTPSFGYDDAAIKVFVDPRIQQQNSILFTGGGSEKSLCAVHSSEMVRAVLAAGGSVGNVSDRAK